MSKVIRFLEAMGRTSVAARYSEAEYTAAVEALDIDAAQREALLDRNHAKLNDLLGGRSKMFFGLVPAENDEPKDDEEQDDVPEQD